MVCAKELIMPPLSPQSPLPVPGHHRTTQHLTVSLALVRVPSRRRVFCSTIPMASLEWFGPASVSTVSQQAKNRATTSSPLGSPDSGDVLLDHNVAVGSSPAIQSTGSLRNGGAEASSYSCAVRISSQTLRASPAARRFAVWGSWLQNVAEGSATRRRGRSHVVMLKPATYDQRSTCEDGDDPISKD